MRELHRRRFLKSLGGGIAVLVTTGGLSAQEARRGGREQPRDIAAWLHIAEDGTITVYAGKAEMGQNPRTSLAQAAAEELKAPIEAIRMVVGDTDLTPFDQGTSGSRTTPLLMPVIRRAAATAREMLLDLAAQQWKADRATLVAEAGQIRDAKTGKSLSFGQLTKGQELLREISAGVALTPPAQWQVSGKPIRKITGPDLVTGKHKYPSDIRRPGMLYGKVLRAPAFNATLAFVDVGAAEAMPGVTVVRDGGFVGVVAPSTRAAARAVAAIQAEWNPAPAQPSNADLFAYLKKNAAESGRSGGAAGFTQGSVEAGLAAAAKKLSQTYTVAYIAHAPLEPRAAVAEWNDDKLTVWTGSQQPFGIRRELAAAFRISEEQVRVIIPDPGSGYGGKHSGEAAIEAARLAKAAGKPVKLLWTREEEFTWAYFRPAGVIEVSSGISAEGLITAWEFHNYNSGGAAIRTYYEIPNQRIEYHPVRSPLRQGSYRALAATANQFARETHMDELAHLAGSDPLAFRLRNLTDPRLRAVFQAAADRFGWGKQKPTAQRGFGIGGGFEKNGYVATCAEVEVDAEGKVAVKRIVTAFECGAVVNPDQLKNQIEGMAVMALGGALFEQIRFENGKILNPRFSAYRVPRFSDLPTIEAVLVDRKDLPSAGAGETPITAVAPAIGNAIFQAAGMRLRSLPLVPNGLPKG
jgi:nicotinate dehydrogenase subunit B